METHLTFLDFAVRLSIVMALVLANGYFVCIEFALVGARRTHIDALAEKGHRRARIAQHAIRHLDRYISGTQLGITVASLGLGWFGEETIAAMLIQSFEGLPQPWDAVASHAVAGTVAFLFITFLHIVLGELAPKSVALLHPEGASVWLAGPLVAFSRLMAPFIWTLNGAANGIIRLLGMDPPTEIEQVHAPEEIAMLVRQSHEHGILEERSRAMIEGVFELTETTVGEVMTPRTDVVAVEISTPLEEVEEIFLQEGHTRFPAYENDIDHIVGILLSRTVWSARRGRKSVSLRELTHAAFFVPSSKRIQPLIGEMLREQIQMAVVLDEFGGTAGIVTLEDLIEEIVGEIRDEHELERPEIIPRTPGVYSVAASTPLEDLERELGISVPETEHYTTVGGYVMESVGRIPEVGDEAPIPGGTLEVATMRGRRIVRLMLRLDPDPPVRTP